MVIGEKKDLWRKKFNLSKEIDKKRRKKGIRVSFDPKVVRHIVVLVDNLRNNNIALPGSVKCYLDSFH